MALLNDEKDLQIRTVVTQERIAEAQESIAEALRILAQSSIRFMDIVETEFEEEKKYQNSLKR